MLVTQLLKAKQTGPEGIVVIAPTKTIADAVSLLSARRIGALVVSDDGKKPVGILSERDIVRELASRGPAVLNLPISEVMTSKVQTCTPDENAMSVLERMTNGRFRHLPVMNEAGEMIGLVSIGDAVFGRLQELSNEKEALTSMIMGA